MAIHSEDSPLIPPLAPAESEQVEIDLMSFVVRLSRGYKTVLAYIGAGICLGLLLCVVLP